MKTYIFTKNCVVYHTHFTPSFAKKGDLFIKRSDGWFRHVGVNDRGVEFWRVDQKNIAKLLNKGFIIPKTKEDEKDLEKGC